MDHLLNAVSPAEAPVAQLYLRHARMLWLSIRPSMASKEDAEDLLVEVFVTAMQSPTPLLHLSESQQLAWLRRVAHHKRVDGYRHQRRQPPMSSLDQLTETLVADEDGTPERLALRQEDAQRLREQVALLPEMQQQVLLLRFAHNLRTKEIAQRLNKSDSAIRMILSRTLTFLRSLCEPDQGGQ